MRIGVLAFPAFEKCQYFDNIDLKFCEKKATKGFCDEHINHRIIDSVTKTEIFDSTAFFYLDKNNLNYFSDDVLENWLSGLNSALKDKKYFQEALSLLNLTNEFDLQSLKTNYRLLAKVHHPDMNNKNNKEYEKFLEINRAYQYLLRCLI